MREYAKNSVKDLGISGLTSTNESYKTPYIEYLLSSMNLKMATHPHWNWKVVKPSANDQNTDEGR